MEPQHSLKIVVLVCGIEGSSFISLQGLSNG